MKMIKKLIIIIDIMIILLYIIINKLTKMTSMYFALSYIRCLTAKEETMSIVLKKLLKDFQDIHMVWEAETKAWEDQNEKMYASGVRRL